MIELKDVTVRYDRRYSRHALEHINMTVKKEKIVVIGPNGSGKTTLLKVLLGLVQIESGKAYVNGMDIRTIKGETGVSTNMVEVYRIMGATVKDLINIYSDLKGSDPAGPRDMVYEFGLEDILDKKIHQISSGEQKMIGNIMSLSFNPSLILMDEPFDNVDQGRRLKLLDAVEKTDTEMIINTHEFDMLNRLQGWGLYFIIEGKLFGKFQVSQLKNLYINRGELSESLAVMDTSFGKFSITENSGSVPIVSARNLNAIFDEVA
ncbi:MAG: ATP-binding cassette domain-containing protein [Thermoplasmata archaeon]